jgi:hypothetical protein
LLPDSKVSRILFVVGEETVEWTIDAIDRCARAFLTGFDSEP